MVLQLQHICLLDPDLSFEKRKVEDSEGEVARLLESFETAKSEVIAIREKAAVSLGEEEAQVFDAHLMVLSDPEMIGSMNANIRDNGVNAESALSDVAGMFIGMFEAMEDNPYMQERADIRDVTERVLSHLLGVKIPNPSTITEEVIVVAKDLTPSDTTQLNRDYVKSSITDIGGRTSHSAIMARSLEIPAIVGSKEITQIVKDGDIIILDGLDGDVFVNPDEETLAAYKKKAEIFLQLQAEWHKLKMQVQLLQTVNISIGKLFLRDAYLEGVVANGAEAVELCRTEIPVHGLFELPIEMSNLMLIKLFWKAWKANLSLFVQWTSVGIKNCPCGIAEEMNQFLGYHFNPDLLVQTNVPYTIACLVACFVYGKCASCSR